MKYAREVIELMAAHPGVEFRMAQIVRYVSGAKELSARRRDAIRKGVIRVLDELQRTGQIARRVEARNSVYYSWFCPKVGHEVGESMDAMWDN